MIVHDDQFILLITSTTPGTVVEKGGGGISEKNIMYTKKNKLRTGKIK